MHVSGYALVNLRLDEGKFQSYLVLAEFVAGMLIHITMMGTIISNVFTAANSPSEVSISYLTLVVSRLI